jgi:tetratricopeptide (TPR) repeat protein
MSFSKAIVVSLLLHVSLYAQGHRLIRGEVLSSQSFLGSFYFAQIYDQATHLVIERTPVSSAGQFEFRDLGSGSYVVQIATESGDAIASATVDNVSTQGPIQIRLPAPHDAKPISEVVSVARLQHPPARKAYSEMVKAQKFALASDIPQAIEHLRKAIGISPGFADAHTNLGGHYIRTGRFEEGLAEYRTVMTLGPAGPVEFCNLSVALFATRRIPEAEEAARRAVALDSSSPVAHYLLARALLVDPAKRAEARQHLTIAARSIPQAATYLAMF